MALPIWNFLLPVSEPLPFLYSCVGPLAPCNSLPSPAPQSRLEQELGAVPKLKKYWGILQKRDQQLDQPARERWVGLRRSGWGLLCKEGKP